LGLVGSGFISRTHTVTHSYSIHHQQAHVH